MWGGSVSKVWKCLTTAKSLIDAHLGKQLRGMKGFFPQNTICALEEGAFLKGFRGALHSVAEQVCLLRRGKGRNRSMALAREWDEQG